MKRAVLILVAVCLLILPSMALATTIVKGTALEEGGGPVLASILAYKKNASGGWDFTGAEQTDADGHFAFTYLGEGTFAFACDAYTDCNPQENYCEDKYLSEFYNNVPIYDFKNKTIVILKNGDVKKLDTFRVKMRPFYFKNAPISCTQSKADGSVSITRKVVNSTDNRRWMLFWGVMDSPHRTDHTDYFDLQASFPFEGLKLQLLEPGVNTVTFTHKVIPKALKGRYEYWLVGGDASGMPMTPYLHGWICYGVTDAQRPTESSIETGASGKGAERGNVKTIPTSISDEGEILERGLLYR